MSKKIMKHSFENLAKQMDEAGLTEATYESSFMWGIFKTKSHLSKQQNNHAPIAQAAPIAQVAPAQIVHAAPVAPVAPTQVSPTAQAAPAPAGAAAGDTIASPMVGVVYFEPEPGAKPFVTVGSPVSEGDTICLVEAMKTFNPVKARKSGTIVEILVNNGDTVEFGTPLVVIN